MMNLPFAVSTGALALGNLALATFFWIPVSENRPQSNTTPQLTKRLSTDMSVAPTIAVVSRRGDPTSARLFGIAPMDDWSQRPPQIDAARRLEPPPRLLGIIFAEGTEDERVAVVQYGSPPRVARLRTGTDSDASGWRAQQILSSSVELRRGAEQIILKLD